MPHRLITSLRLMWRKRFGVLPLRDSLVPLADWFDSPLGKLILASEQELIDRQLPDLFGYHLLQLSVSNRLQLSETSRISHRFAMHPQRGHEAKLSAQTDFNHLPLPSSSIDLVLLHHVLDYSQSPHHVLREAAATLISQGHLVIVGFNPWSLLGIWRWLVRWFSRAPQWRHQSLRLGRVLDWLELLDFEPIHVCQGFYCPPFQHQNAIKYLHWMDRWGKRLGLPCGGSYLIVARKDTAAFTPMKPQWETYPGLRAWGVTKILGRSTRHGRFILKPFGMMN